MPAVNHVRKTRSDSDFVDIWNGLTELSICFDGFLDLATSQQLLSFLRACNILNILLSNKLWSRY